MTDAVEQALRRILDERLGDLADGRSEPVPRRLNRPPVVILPPPPVQPWTGLLRAADSLRGRWGSVLAAAYRTATPDMSGLTRACASRDAATAIRLLLAAVDGADAYLRTHLSHLAVAGLKAGADASTFHAGRMAAARDARPVVTYALDVTNPRAEDWAKRYSSRLVTEVSAETRRAIRRSIGRAFSEEIPPKLLARELKNIIGLTEAQSEAVANLRDKLLRNAGRSVKVRGWRVAVPDDDDPDARDERIDRAIEKYSEQLLNDRALTIARTETMAASNEGQRQLWLQAVDDGLLTGDEQRLWLVTPDDRLCPYCADMEGETAGLEEPFESDQFDEVMGPPLHPNCRCTTGIVDMGRRRAAMGWRAGADHKYGIVLVEVDPTSSAAASINSARDQIDDADLMGDGKDVDGNHITVRYGLLNDDVVDLRAYLSSLSPFEVRLGQIELFDPSEHSDWAVPVVVRVISTDLRRIHTEVDQHGDFKANMFARYKPHVTLAYVKPEAAEKYRDLFVHGSFEVHALTIGNAEGEKEAVAFGARAAEFDPNQPRDPDGKWTSGGGGIAADKLGDLSTSLAPATVARIEARLKEGVKVYRGVRPEGRPAADPGDFGIGAYHSSSRARASNYGRLIEVTLKLERPLVLTSTEAYDKLTQAYDTVTAGSLDARKANATTLTSVLRARGYDGLAVVNTHKGGTGGEIEYVKFPEPREAAEWDESQHPRSAAFDPNQPRDEKGQWTDTGIGDLAGKLGSYSKVSLGDVARAGNVTLRLRQVRPGFEDTHVYAVVPRTLPDRVKEAKVGFKGSSDAWYDPTLATIETDANGYTRAVPKAGLSTDMPDVAEEGTLYRGLSYGEWVKIREQGFIESSGDYNLGETQKGLTYYSTDPEQAANYAAGFTPWQYTPTFDRPAVVVKIKDPGTSRHVAGTGPTERGVPGRVALDQIEAVYEGAVYQFKPGEVEFYRQNSGLYGEGSRSSPSAAVVWRKRDATFRAAAEWNEADHPRGEAGRFAPSGGVGSSRKTSSGESVEALTARLRSEHPGLTLDIRMKAGGKPDAYGRTIAELELIELPKDRRQQGVGTRVMEDVVAWADTRGITMTLQPASRDDRFGITSRARLVRFYKRFGFVENKGRHGDSSLSMYAAMYRKPKMARTAAGWARALGGPGSGNFGHAGRPGEVGGSAPGDGPSEAHAKLENERAKAVEHLTSLVPQAIAQARPPSVEAPGDWDSVDSDTQSEAFYKYEENAQENIYSSSNFESAYSEVRDEQKKEIIEDSDFETTQIEAAIAAFEKVYAHSETDLLGERTTTIRLDPDTVSVSTYSENSGTNPPDMSLDLSAVRTVDGHELTDEEKDTLQSEFDAIYSKAFTRELDERMENEQDHINELDSESISQQISDEWSNMSDDEKLAFARDEGLLKSVRIRDVREPQTWVLGLDERDKGTEDYALTHAIGNSMALLRTNEILNERGLSVVTPPPFTVIKTDQTTPSGEPLYDVVNEQGVSVATSLWPDEALAQSEGKSWQIREVDKRDTSRMISSVWENWKDSSSGDLGLALQLAAARELGGTHRLTADEIREAEDAAKEYGGMEHLQAYARAQWETTQFLMAKAGKSEVEVYRAVYLPNDVLNAASYRFYDRRSGLELKPGEIIEEPRTYAGSEPKLAESVVRFKIAGDQYVTERFKGETVDQAITRRLFRAVTNETGWQGQMRAQLADVKLIRSGAQSTTMDRSVANNWQGVGKHKPPDSSRVVLRARVPSTSVFSLPVHGQNIQEEREVVVAGTRDPWDLDAWFGWAPDFTKVALPKTTVTQRAAAKAKPIVIDMQAADRDQPHWLSEWPKKPARLRTADAEFEAKHPRGEGGKFTEGDGTGSGKSIDSPQFKAWFKGSKVVDAKGQPLVMYHGTTASFDEFKHGAGSRSDIGFHFGSKEAAHAVFESKSTGLKPKVVPERGRNIMPVYLSIQNPLRVPDLDNFFPEDIGSALERQGLVKDGAEWTKRVRDEGKTSALREFDRLAPGSKTKGDLSDAGVSYDRQLEILQEADYEATRKALERMGYDGLVYENQFEGGGDSYVAFRPEQVKSAIGNKGTFDPKSPLITADGRFAFREDQERDERGRWVDEAGVAVDSGGRIGLPSAPGVTRALAPKIAERMGFNPADIVYDESEGTHFTVGGREFLQAGHYDAFDGKVHLNEKVLDRVTEEGLAGLITHEMTHDAWAKTYMRVLDKKTSVLAAKINVTPESTAFADFVAQRQDDLRRDDGITEYSQAYWRDYEGALTYAAQHKTPEAAARVAEMWRDAMNETLAEVVRAENAVEGSVSETWRQAHAAMMAAYKAEQVSVQRARAEARAAGGPGSGNFGHAGRPGEVGGSAPAEGATKGSTATLDRLPDVPVLKGVDSHANADRYISEHAGRSHIGEKITPERMAAVRKELDALPLVHGTNVEAAVEAFTDGLRSAKEMEAHKAEFTEDIHDLKTAIAEKTGESVEDMNLEDFDYRMEPRDLEDQFGLTREDAERVSADMQRLHELEQVVATHTYDADRRLGLDHFVFSTHGQRHQDYGPIGVVVDNAVLDRSFATPKDIVVVNSKQHIDLSQYDPDTDLPPSEDGEYPPQTVAAYQHDLMVGREDYLRAAASDGLSAEALPYRSRDQLWEIKTPSIKKGEVLGFFTDDLDEGIRLADRLGREGHVLVTGDTSDGSDKEWLADQLKYLQAHGMWDEDAIRAYADEHDGAGIMLL